MGIRILLWILILWVFIVEAYVSTKYFGRDGQGRMVVKKMETRLNPGRWNCCGALCYHDHPQCPYHPGYGENPSCGYYLEENGRDRGNNELGCSPCEHQFEIIQLDKPMIQIFKQLPPITPLQGYVKYIIIDYNYYVFIWIFWIACFGPKNIQVVQSHLTFQVHFLCTLMEPQGKVTNYKPKYFSKNTTRLIFSAGLSRRLTGTAVLCVTIIYEHPGITHDTRSNSISFFISL